MKIDNVSFNVDAVKKMSEDEFIKSHLALKQGLTYEANLKWLEMCYCRITGKNKKSTKQSPAGE